MGDLRKDKDLRKGDRGNSERAMVPRTQIARG